MHKEYAQTADQVLSDLQSGPEGLSAAQAEGRLAEYGPNRLREAPKATLLQRFLQQLRDPMLLILMAAAAVSAVTNYLSHEPFTEVLIILAVVLLNAVLGVVQESKAEAAIEALQTMTAATSKVLRVANTPSRMFPPRRGGRARGGSWRAAAWYPAISSCWRPGTRSPPTDGCWPVPPCKLRRPPSPAKASPPPSPRRPLPAR